MSVRLRLAKEFYSLQGEGALTGTPMYFVRTAGCSVSECPLHPSHNGICDTNWSFTKDDEIEAIARRAKESLAKWVCITGGEPTDQLDAVQALAKMIRGQGQFVMIQTSGVKALSYCWDWVAVSPKSHHTLLRQKYGDELKVVWNGESFRALQELATNTKFTNYYLQPLAQSNGSTNVQDVAKVVLEMGESQPWRLGIQQHKVWGGE